MLDRQRTHALNAMRQAMRLARLVQSSAAGLGHLTKPDRSPVTVADFAIQALVAREILRLFPDDQLVGEEDTASLRHPQAQPLLERVASFLGRIAPDFAPAAILDWIDRGAGRPGGRFWTLDPVDGTKGFLRGDQFAIALALIEEGRVQLAVLGCPRLTRLGAASAAEGMLLSATRGGGAWLHDIGGSDIRLAASGRSLPAAWRFVESYESSHSDAEGRSRLQELLGARTPVRQLDGQSKYALVAGGEAEIYLRIPHPDHLRYREKIWDHAAGSLIVEEAGGRVSDIYGRPLDFSHGRSLSENVGILATNGDVHAAVLAGLTRIMEPARQ